MKKYSYLVIVLLLASFLRFYRLESVPVSLFGDEMDVGYQAYSILKTGNDYYGNPIPLHFHSLAEWRTPLYLYSAVPTVALFGISPLGVRLPAAIFGVLSILAFYFLLKTIRESHLKLESSKLEVVGAFLLAISPWHIQYSRAAFEVTELLFFLILGIYFFLKGTRDGKYLWLSTFCLALTPWIYSTAKMFVPFLLVFLTISFRRELIKVSKKHLLLALVALLVVGLPIAASTVFGGGSQRFGYISVFTDPTTEHEIGVARDVDNWGNSAASRAFHNKFMVWAETIGNNLLQSYSTDFLFIRGDINLRHSIEGVGMFYKVEIVTLLLGVIYVFGTKFDKRIKYLLAFWLIAGIVPSAITREGGSHATRLIVVLPPLVALVTFGVVALAKNKALIALYGAALFGFFVIYQHNFWVHNPKYSERWWHYGWQESVDSIKAVEGGFEKIVISTADEPPWVFFAAAYEYDPARWQSAFPLDNKTELTGFGLVSYIDKYYFGSPSVGLYDWGKVIDAKTLYLASTREVGVNLIREPERTPGDLKLINSIAFPSGEPAFYLFTHK